MGSLPLKWKLAPDTSFQQTDTLLPPTKNPHSEGNCLDTIKECWKLHSRPRKPSQKKSLPFPSSPPSSSTHSPAPLGQLLQPALPDAPAPSQPSEPSEPSPPAAAPPARLSAPCYSPRPPLLRGPCPPHSPAAPHPTQPGPQPSQPHPGRKEPRPPRACRRATRPGPAPTRQHVGGFTSEAVWSRRSVWGAGDAPAQSVSSGGDSGGGTSHRLRSKEGSEPRREGASEVGGKEPARKVTQLDWDWVPSLLPVPPTAASGWRVAARAAAVATDAAGNECTAAPHLSGGQTSFCLGHPDRHRTRKWTQGKK